MISTLWATALLTAVASAQPAPSRADPADPNARSEPLQFASGLVSKEPAAEVDPPARWREHNERVRAIGGHAGSLRSANVDQAPAKSDAAQKGGKP
jgi:hypothetical protein